MDGLSSSTFFIWSGNSLRALISSVMKAELRRFLIWVKHSDSGFFCIKLPDGGSTLSCRPQRHGIIHKAIPVAPGRQIHIPLPLVIIQLLRVKHRGNQKILADKELVIEKVFLIIIERFILRIIEKEGTTDRLTVQGILNDSGGSTFGCFVYCR